MVSKGYWRLYYQKNREKKKAQAKQGKLKLKIEILTHYGSGVSVCAICGEARLACLSIDHIEGGGAEHRRSLRKWGNAFYYWLRRNNFPEGYQTLCMNCQWVKKEANGESLRGKNV